MCGISFFVLSSIDESFLSFLERECLGYLSLWIAYTLGQLHHQASWGLRQGDPLSPFLFLFVADALSALISKSMREDGLQGVKNCRGAHEISHLLFADDSLLFFHATEQQAVLVKGLLNTFASATGQFINPSKCSILFSDHCLPSVVTVIKSVLEITQEVFEPKYLGLPVPEGRMHLKPFKNV